MSEGAERLVAWLALASLVMFVLTLILIPVIIIALKPDYFALRERHPARWRRKHPLVCLLLIVIRNLLGLTFVLIGVIMIVTPGQGVLTILVGMTLMNYPGKYRAERWLITRHSVWRFANWLRRRAGAAELIRPEHDK